MNSKVRQVPKNLQEQVFITPKETLPELVKFLVKTNAATSSYVQILHDWICDNIAYDCDVFTSKGVGDQDYETVLKKKKAICIGYCNLMAAMCNYAKIEVAIIHGWSKDLSYNGYLDQKGDHAWNAVKIGGKWKLIDVTWDAGYTDRGYFIKSYTLQWFNLSPAQFIYSHLPEEEKWQLLPEKQIRSKEQFEKEPFIPGLFFEYGLSFGKNVPKYTNEISGATSFDIITKGNVVMLSKFYEANTSSDMNSALWVENKGNTKCFIFDVPDKKTYTALFSVKLKGRMLNSKYFSKTNFERKILPNMKNLLSTKKITQKEAELFENSYFLIDENNRYYYADDVFDSLRIQATSKILKLLGQDYYETILKLNIKAAPDYEGFGKNVIRFPHVHPAYNDVSNITLISPLKGTLKRGSEEHFSIKTNSGSSFMIVTVEKEQYISTRIPKNKKTGVYEIDFKISENVEKLELKISSDIGLFYTIIYYGLE